MDFFVATDVVKILPNQADELRQEEWGQDYQCLDQGRSLSHFVDLFLSNQLIVFPLSQGTLGSRWELSHLAGLPGGGGVVLGSVIL